MITLTPSPPATRLLRFFDTGKTCLASLRMADGAPCSIRVTLSGVVVKRSRLGLLGPVLFARSSWAELTPLLGDLAARGLTRRAPAGMRSPTLRLLTDLALTCGTLDEVVAQLEGPAARELAIG